MNQLDRIESAIDELRRDLADPQQGLYVRVDRLEKKEERRDIWRYQIIGMWVTSIGALLTSVAAYFAAKFGFRS